MTIMFDASGLFDGESLARNYHKLMTVDAIKLSYQNHLKYSMAKDEFSATDHDRYYALALTIRDRLVERWIETSQTYYKKNVKRMYYLSLEYLMGRALVNNVVNLRFDTAIKQAIEDLGMDWDLVADLEKDAGLGNGGLGRLAACFLDSLATLELPGYGYGIRYDYGIFRQVIQDGHQVEEPDQWLAEGNPWELKRPSKKYEVPFGGKSERGADERGREVYRWIDTEKVLGVAYDNPIAGYGNNTVNNLCLWQAVSSDAFDFEIFNNGDYVKAVEDKTSSENITKVLYPNDKIEQGKELRFKQQYFFVSCSLQDILRRYKIKNSKIENFSDKVAIQLNDTHPAIGVAELMRLLLDQERLPWDTAWNIVTQVFGYTNHTLLPEALEKWPVRFFEEMLPRHLQIIYEINRRFLRRVLSKFPNDPDRQKRMSIIEEGREKQVRMAYLSVVGSHSVNGVAALHTYLLKKNLMKDFYELWPEKFNNKTNGITQRRWLLMCNPKLASLITERIGDAWVKDLSLLKNLTKFIDDTEFLRRLSLIKRENKIHLAKVIEKENWIKVNPDSIFDVQVKRLHEYKRQLLNILHIVHRYFMLKDNPNLEMVPRTFIFGAKAAPGYAMAKLIIKLINDIASVVNNDPDIKGRLKVVFLANYRVSLAEKIIPASDVSEQISTAGKEASGTGNMKFALNGALTVGTLDGANIEIREEVGKENFFLFGKTVEELDELRPGYNPWDYYHKDPRLKRILDTIAGGFFNTDEPDLYRPIWTALLDQGDPYFHLADFNSYLKIQEEVDKTYLNQDKWVKMCLQNIARIGKFSSDRTIAEYAKEVWDIEACKIDLPLDDKPVLIKKEK